MAKMCGGHLGVCVSISENQETSPTSEVSEELLEHYETVVPGLVRGMVTPVLGAGASLYGRTGANDWRVPEL